jgi:hypothetical protein
MSQRTIHASAVRGLPKSNLSAILSPSATDDSSAGYSVGSIWVDTALDKAFTCVDSTIGAAVWSASGGSSEQLIFIQDDEPTSNGLWIQTNIGGDPTNFSLWIKE